VGYNLLGTDGFAWGVVLAYVVMAAVTRWRANRLRDRVPAVPTSEDAP
jgi:uncharacterized membrane protein